ncbi:patatin-like phospholipase family protein [Flexibacterium corallicola]|uniref:patatin-like phospholipase family protein n=1 Tax=Flexibacterium corallicola TaxID=3037259 RepID=UPI00286ECE9D|nr:patatin-like phospholipase family protein [Pseudovibrio sp. M1P-2-3]
MPKKFKILSFCGGGIRGLISAQLLVRLNKYYMETLKSEESLSQAGCLLAGTSTGSIISNFLASGLDPEEVRDFYEFVMPVMMSKKNTDPSKPEYGTADIINFITEHFPQLDIGKKFGDLPAGKHALMTSFTVSKDTPQSSGDMPTWGPVLFHNMKTGGDNHRWCGTPDVSMLYASMCSGAMPGMMGSMDIPESKFFGMVDGAFLHHDPTFAAISTAIASGISLEDITVIDFGTGLMPQFINDADATKNWGTKQFMEHQEVPAANMQPLFVNWPQQSPLMNMCLNGTSTDMVPSLSQMMLGDRYVYLNPDLAKPIAEDDTKPQAIVEMLKAANSLDLSKAEDLLLNCWCDSPIQMAQDAQTTQSGISRPN